MSSPVLLFLLLFFLACVLGVPLPLPNLNWDYQNWQDWPNMFPACGGIEQSPIDLTAAASTGSGIELDMLGGTEWDANTPSLVTINHNGTVFSLLVPAGSDVATLKIPGVSEVYHMVNLHIHTPSEHTINGKRFDVELHMVHAATGDFGQQLEAVVSVLFEGVTDRDSNIVMDSADCFMNEYALAGYSGLQGKDISISLRQFGEELETVAWERYRGSLTTPPCTEGVHWIIVSQPMYIRKATTDWLHMDLGLNNSRPTQALNGRNIYQAQISLESSASTTTTLPTTPDPASGDSSFLNSFVGKATVIGVIVLGFVAIAALFAYKMSVARLAYKHGSNLQDKLIN